MFIDRCFGIRGLGQVLAIGLTLLWSEPVQANCGLDLCPMHEETVDTDVSLRPTLRVRATSMDADAGYVETVAGMTYAVHPRLLLGVQVPMVMVQQGERSSAGLGNIVATGSWSVLDSGDDWVLDLGAQIEVPTVTDASLGDGHLLVLPTVQAGWHPGSVIWMAVLGWGQVLGGEHHHHAAGSIVNPHANSELLLRLDGGRSWSVGDGLIRGTVRVDSIQVMGHHSSGDLIVNLGPTLGFSGERLNSEIFVLSPVTEANRYQMRVGLRMGLRFP